MSNASSLERARIAAGLTYTDVAARTSRTTTQVRRWERGQAVPPQHVLLALAALFGVAPAELVD